jgi:hypothetical protein
MVHFGGVKVGEYGQIGKENRPGAGGAIASIQAIRGFVMGKSLFIVDFMSGMTGVKKNILL